MIQNEFKEIMRQITLDYGMAAGIAFYAVVKLVDPDSDEFVIPFGTIGAEKLEQWRDEQDQLDKS